MGAGNTTIDEEVDRQIGRPFVDLDREIERRHGAIAALFESSEPTFRRSEEQLAAQVLSATRPGVIALGGGAVLSERTRRLLREHAFTVWIDVEIGEAWNRVRGGDRPPRRARTAFQ